MEVVGNNCVRVWMPPPDFRREHIPVQGEGECVEFTYDLRGSEFKFTALSLGNPHCVLFGDFDIDTVMTWGSMIECWELFPQRTNVEFAQIIAPNTVYLTVWERGVDITEACGSGVCAAVAAAIKTGKMKLDEKISVEQNGRVLQVIVKEYFREVILEGEAIRVFKGEID